MSLVPPLAKGEFYFRSQDIEVQQEFLSYPKGKHDDCMDAIYYALDGAKPCRVKDFDPEIGLTKKTNKFLDWMSM